MNQQKPPTVEEIETALGLAHVQRRGRLMRRVMVGLLVAALALGAHFIYTRTQAGNAALFYETLPARFADVTITVLATGTIQPITQVDIGSEASGVVRDVLVDDNDTVKVGDTLAVLDTTRLSAQHARITAQLKAAEARHAEAEATLAERVLAESRIKALRQKGLSSGQDMDAAEAATKRADASLAAALADIAAAKADLAIIETDIGKTRIVSPINGVVLKRSIEPGQTVASSLQAPVLFQIAQDLTRIQLEAAVDEADIGLVKVGQQARFTVEAYRNRDFPARIERLSFAPVTVDGVVTYTAVLSAENVDFALRPGMTATARIIVEQYEKVLTVPNEALRYQPPMQEEAQRFSITHMFMPRFPRAQRGKREASADGTRVIYVLENGKPVERRIKTGASDGKVTVVLDGPLIADDPLVIAQKPEVK